MKRTKIFQQQRRRHNLSGTTLMWSNVTFDPNLTDINREITMKREDACTMTKKLEYSYFDNIYKDIQDMMLLMDSRFTGRNIVAASTPIGKSRVMLLS